MLLAVTLAVGCGGESGPGFPAAPRLALSAESGNLQTGEASTELAEPLTFRVRAAGTGAPREGVPVTFEVTAGGGSLSAASVETDADGLAAVSLTLGRPPVQNRVRASAAGADVTFTAQAGFGEPPILELLHEGPAGTGSEDLAFDASRGLFLGIQGGLLRMASPGAAAAPVELTGEPLGGPVGIAFGTTGDLYACNTDETLGGSLKRIAPSGACETLSPGFDGSPYALPNHIAVHSSGTIYMSATCDDTVFRISPETGESSPFVSIPGPNGLALDPGEEHLYILTENPAIFCAGVNVMGGLYRVALSPDGTPGPVEALLEGVAVAGDGMAFDVQGNLYAVFSGMLDRPEDLDRLLTSGVFVYTPDGRFDDFFSVRLPADIITNVAFGKPPFETDALYCYGFTGRLYRARVGIPGRQIP